MRTSRISRDTSKVLASLPSRPTRSRPPQQQSSAAAAALHAFASGNAPAAPDVPTLQAATNADDDDDSELSSVPDDVELEDSEAKSEEAVRKRKRSQGQGELLGDGRVKRGRGGKDTSTAAAAAATTTPTPTASITTSTTTTTATAVTLNPKALRAVKPDPDEQPALAPARPKLKKARRAPAKRIAGANGTVKVEPPADWEAVYAVTKRMRAAHPAPVDTMGCARLADPAASPRDQRFQTLVALMLSSQTKDTVTAVAMERLREGLSGGFNLESILAVEPAVLNGFIEKVGFHNNKTKYIKAAADVLRTSFNSDIPDTIEGLTSLPGVGPKMAYLCMSVAWGRDEGIGVDVHVHRITNLWGWHKTKTPEETRTTLESWLPRDRWHDINDLLVGFGQTICLPVGRKCGECTLAEKGMCPSAVVGKTTKVKKEKVDVVKEEDLGDVLVKEEVDVIEEHEIKAEDVEDKIPDIEDLGRSSSRRSRRPTP